jgi:hypothetical protein
MGPRQRSKEATIEDLRFASRSDSFTIYDLQFWNKWRSFWCLKRVFRQAKGKSAAIFVDKTGAEGEQ